MIVDKRWPFYSFILLLVGIASCGVLLFGWFSFPPTAWIIRNYVDAIIASDLEKALTDTGNIGLWTSCTAATKAAALEDMALFGDSEIRNLKLEVVGSGGSDQTIQVGRAYFEYKKLGESTWQAGYTQLLTTYHSFGFRYPCGKFP